MRSAQHGNPTNITKYLGNRNKKIGMLQMERKRIQIIRKGIARKKANESGKLLFFLEKSKNQGQVLIHYC
jgi:hypothetical protein